MAEPQDRTAIARLMEMHAYPQIGRIPVGEIDLDAALRVLRPIWQSMNFSARRLMFFCRAAIDATRGEAGGLHPDRLNPFAWGGNLKHRLAKPSKLVKEEHHKALGWKQIRASWTRCMPIRARMPGC